MGLFDKVKNFFYEDVEEEDVKKPVFKKKEKPVEKEDIEFEIEDKKIEEKTRSTLDNDVSEMELFKSERTFNFPMDIDDDDVFEIKNNREERVKEEPKIENTNSYKRATLKTFDSYSGISKATLTNPSSGSSTMDNTKFKPSPVISPVYGILDKNYTVDDVVDKNLSKTKEFSVEKKIVDFDTVRNRAYKDLDEEIEKTLTGTKDIFFNLDDGIKEEKKESDESSITDDVDLGDDDVIITFDSEEEPKENVEDNTDIQEEEEVPIIKKKRRSKVEDDEEEPKSKDDLFNLIDNMYKDEEEEDE